VTSAVDVCSCPPTQLAAVPLLVALDIDGTLLGEDRLVAPVTERAVTAARAAGHHVVLATGRSVVGMAPVARALGIVSGWAVASSGAVIVRLDPGVRTGYVVDQVHTFDVEPVARLIHEAEPDLQIAVEELGWGYRTSARFPGALNGNRRVVTCDEIGRRPTTRAIVRGAGVHGLVGALRALGLTVTWSGPDSVDVTPFGLSKATALEKIRERLGIRPGDTVAVGDSYNDIGMLGWAARSVAMGQAPADLLAVVGEVTGTVRENGVVDVLRSITPGSR
jgi:hydroxymethylpyrimidine pyrophosphatase-like HAD family hydrolase